MKSKISDEQFGVAVAGCLSVAQVIKRLGLVPAGGNYKTVKDRIAALGLDTNHFTGSGWNVGERYRNFGRQYRLEDILIENSPYAFTHGLRNRLLKEGYKAYKCEQCGLTEWLSQPIPLELHHMNGVSNDHRLENLQLLCPNCHAQTTSYRGKNQLRASARVV
ncbi:HNH endonuclease [Hymenobacter lucidus]|uniref:HNH endonuclease n=1 Tax=Hymenobacter lucidus TaxID=2880930 RepID=A0ABS8AL01_9BACT|nr:HNH endonuclease signature motif containing protein [Hymenobacter lucidus]MCB2406880.1 HNH endonuclease [Hymenobacter lucidus]